MAVNVIDNKIMYGFTKNARITFQRMSPRDCLFITPPNYEISNVEKDGSVITVTKCFLPPAIEDNISNKLKEKVQDLKEVIVKSENDVAKISTSADDDNSTNIRMINVHTTTATVVPTTTPSVVPTVTAVHTTTSAVVVPTTAPASTVVPTATATVVPTTSPASTVVPTTAAAPTVAPTTAPTVVSVASLVTNNSSNNLLLLKSSLVDLIDSARSVATYTDKVYMLKHILKYIGQEYDMDRTVIITNEQEIKLKFGQIITTLSTSSLSHLCGVLVVAMI